MLFPRSFPFGFINLSSRPRTHVAVNRESRGPSGLHHMDALQHELWNVLGTHATTATETPMAFASKERQCQHGCEGLNCPAIWGSCGALNPPLLLVTIMSHRPTMDIEVDICLMYWNSTFSEYFKVQKVGWLVDVGCNPGRLMF